MSARGTLAIVAMLVAGCVPSNAGWRGVRTTVHERTGTDLVLLRESSDPQRIDGRVRAMLAHPLGPDEAVAIALLHSPRIQESLESLGVARADLLGASFLPNPEFDSETRLGREMAGDEFESHIVIDVTALVTLPLRRAAAEAALAASQLESASDVLDLALEVRQTFLEHQAHLQLFEMMHTVVETTRASYDTAQALFDAGNVAFVEVVAERSLYEESRLALVQEELAVLESRERLQAEMGLFGAETEWEAVPRLADLPEHDPPLESLEERAVEQSLALAGAQQRLESFARAHGVARTRGILPDLRAGVSGSFADRQWAFGPAVSMTLPVFDQGQARADRIEAELRTEQMRYLRTAVEVRSDVRRARNRLLNARERVAFIRDVLLPVRQRFVEETLLQYNAMNATPFQLLQARRDQIDAGRMYIEALRDYWLARAALEQVLAGGRARFEGRAEDRRDPVMDRLREEVVR